VIRDYPPIKAYRWIGVAREAAEIGNYGATGSIALSLWRLCPEHRKALWRELSPVLA
jgi:hypothetical protein